MNTLPSTLPSNGDTNLYSPISFNSNAWILNNANAIYRTELICEGFRSFLKRLYPTISSEEKTENDKTDFKLKWYLKEFTWQAHAVSAGHLINMTKITLWAALHCVTVYWYDLDFATDAACFKQQRLETNDIYTFILCAW